MTWSCDFNPSKTWDTVQAVPGIAESYLQYLTFAADLGEDIDGWNTRREILADLVHVRQQEQRILGLLVEKGIKDDCEGCMLWPIESEYNVQLARLKLGEDAAAGDMFAAYDLLATRAWTKLDPSRTDTEAVVTRRALSYATINLPFTKNAFPHDAATANVLTVVEGAVKRGERFLTQFPRDGFLKQTLGDGLTFLAELYMEGGRSSDSLVAIERAVTLNNIDGIRRLAAWYRSGHGQIPKDTYRAEQLAERLEGAAPVLQVPFLASPLWATGSTPSTYYVAIWQSSDNARSQVDEMLWRAKTLSGVELSEADTIKLRDIEQLARDSGVLFPILVAKELMQYDFGPAASVDSLVAAYYAEIEKAQDNEFNLPAAELLGTALGPEFSRGIALSAIDELVKDTGHPSYDKSMQTLVSLPEMIVSYRFVMAKGNSKVRELSTTIEDAVYSVLSDNFGTMNKKYISSVFFSRSAAYSLSDDEADRQSAKLDKMTAAMILPDDATTLNNIGYEWLKDKVLRGLSIGLLERAVALEGSKGSAALDSLGWAYVENGRLTEGLEYIQRAIKTSKEASGELYHHLAETHRRLGQSEEALQAIDRALALQPIGESADRVLETLKLLEPQRRHDAATRSAALDIARKTAGMTLNRRSVNTDLSGIAINGFDTVAYHTGEAIRGKLVYYVIWQDAVWLFATEENKTLFESNPERYAPAFGGFCSECFRFGAESRLSSVPFYWHIYDGKLFLFASLGLRDGFVSVGAARAERALRDWSLSTFDTDATPSAPSIYMLLLHEAAAEVADAK